MPIRRETNLHSTLCKYYKLNRGTALTIIGPISSHLLTPRSSIRRTSWTNQIIGHRYRQRPQQPMAGQLSYRLRYFRAKNQKADDNHFSLHIS